MSILENYNKHERDEFLQFDETWHKYTYTLDPELKLISVTTFLHDCFEEFNMDLVIAKLIRFAKPGSKYAGKTQADIKNEWQLANIQGTLLHAKIEQFMNSETCPYPYTHEQLLNSILSEKSLTKEDVEEKEDKGWDLFLRFAEMFENKIPFRTEWRVYDIEYQISGSIDMVYLNPEDNTLSIFDWKRTTDLEKREGFRNKMSIRFPSSIPDTKFHKYSLQLNIYKAIVEKNYGYKVKELFLVGLHPQNVSGTFQLMKCVDLSAEVEELFQERLQKIKNI